MQLDQITALLEQLTHARGVSGDEGEIRALLASECQARGARVEYDSLGTLYAIREKPGARRFMAAAHMDEVGFLITAADSDGLLRYAPVGGVDRRVVLGRRLLLGKGRVPGVIGVKPIHLQTEEEMRRVPKHSDLRIDIGAKDKADAEKLCPPGTYGIFNSELAHLEGGRVVSRCLDDRVGCLALLTALEAQDLPVELICAFTVQEEVGLRGGRVAAQRWTPDLAIALEGTACNDLGGLTPKHEQPSNTVARQGEGVTISFMDRSSIAHPALRAAVADCAKAHGIPWQFKHGVAGGNDAGAMQGAFGARPTLSLSVPCRYIHSANSVAALSDIQAQGALLAAFVQDFAQYERSIFA